MDNNTKILIIEDNDNDAFIIDRAIKKDHPGTLTQRASTMARAEQILEHEKVDVVLLDLGLPDTDSPLDTYNHMRKWSSTTPIIVLTHMADHAAAKSLIHDGAADFINKGDCGPHQIENAIDFSLERHANQKHMVDYIQGVY